MPRINREDYAFIFAPRDEVIDADHPDFEYWLEEQARLEITDSAGSLPPDLPQTPDSEKPSRPSAPRLALNLKDAAEALSVSDDHFRENVRPGLKVVYSGRRQFVAVRELEKWLEEHGRS